MLGVKRLIALLYKILSKMGRYDTHHFWRAGGALTLNLLCVTNTGRPLLRLSFLIHRVGITTFPSKTVILEEMMYVKVLSPKQALCRPP